MLTPQALERASTGYRRGYRAGYARELSAYPEGAHNCTHPDPFHVSDYRDGYKAGANDRRWNEGAAAISREVHRPGRNKINEVM